MVRENFEHASRRGWFSGGTAETVVEFPRSHKGGDLGYREAAVLCLISQHSAKPHILITKRSNLIAFKGKRV